MSADTGYFYLLVCVMPHPKVPMAFLEEMIERIEVPMALMYGKEDPWVVPLWAHRIKRQRPETLYYEISPSGHSPHHETPNTVNALLAGWLEHASSGGPAPLSGEGEVLEMEVGGGLPSFCLFSAVGIERRSFSLGPGFFVSSPSSQPHGLCSSL